MRPPTATDGAHIQVTVRMGDPLTVTNECHPTSRKFTNPLVREFLQVLGIRLCPDCHAFVAMADRSGDRIWSHGRWRERP